MSTVQKISGVLLLYAETFAIGAVGELINLLLGFLLTSFLPHTDAWIAGISYVVKIGTWIAVIAFVWLRRFNRPILKCLGKKCSGNTVPMAVAGLAVGFAANGVCVLTAWLRGDIILSYSGFHPLSFILILFTVFIQSGGEELLCRGFLYQRIRHDLNSPGWAVIASALFFAALHLFNSGITVVSFINIILCGILFALSVYSLDSLWFAIAMHTSWNFTQNIVFGLPNSGIVMRYSVFRLESSVDSFAYNTAFGIEGTVTAGIVLALMCLALFCFGRKHPQRGTDLWEA